MFISPHVALLEKTLDIHGLGLRLLHFLNSYFGPALTLLYKTTETICDVRGDEIWGSVTLKHMAPSGVIWNKFHASHWNSFLLFFCQPMERMKLISNDIWWRHTLLYNQALALSEQTLAEMCRYDCPDFFRKSMRQSIQLKRFHLFREFSPCTVQFSATVCLLVWHCTIYSLINGNF